MDQTGGEKEVTESTEGTEHSATQPAEVTDVPRAANPDGAAVSAPSFVYAIGRVEPRFPSLAVEKEFAQAVGRVEDTAGLTDRETLQTVLSERSNRYLARQLCFVLTIEGLETYILVPRDPVDFELLVEAVRNASAS